MANECVASINGDSFCDFNRHVNGVRESFRVCWFVLRMNIPKCRIDSVDQFCSIDYRESIKCSVIGRVV